MSHEGPYNDIQPWAYHRPPEVFGGGWGRRVATEDELDDGLAWARASSRSSSRSCSIASMPARR
jgi:TPP-dependent 2-oxoacid decarboxylase